MKIIHNRKWYIPTWVRVSIIEEMWSPNNILYVSKWDGPPRDVWFDYYTGAFKTADIDILPSEKNIGFVNGRHRTRWLISKGFQQIPVGITDCDFEAAQDLGLAIRLVIPDDQLIVEV